MPRLGRCDAVKALKGAGKALGCVITEAQRNVYGLFVAAPQFVGRARVEYDQRKALEGADFVYAKNWAAYADPNYGKVLCRDRAWTVDAEKMALTDNAFFMHCLPVRRNMIVTDEVIESPRSLVIPEAANREISAQVVLKRLLEGLG